MATKKAAPRKRASGRTTPRKATATKDPLSLVPTEVIPPDMTGVTELFDFDKQERERSKSIPVMRFRVFGRAWKLSEGPNIIALQAAQREAEQAQRKAAEMGEEEGAAYLDEVMSRIDIDPTSMLAAYIDPAERDDFKAAMLQAPNLDWGFYNRLNRALAEAVAGRPTES